MAKQKFTFKPEMCETLIEMGKQGASQKMMWSELGISKDVAENWKKKHPEFAEALGVALVHSQAFWEREMLANVGNKAFNSRIAEIALRGQFPGFVQTVLAAGNGLPILGPHLRPICATDQQNIQRRGIDDHQHGLGNFERFGHKKRRCNSALSLCTNDSLSLPWRHQACASECAIRATAFHQRGSAPGSAGTGRAGSWGRRSRRGSTRRRPSW